MKHKRKAKKPRRIDRLREIESTLDEMVERLGQIETTLQQRQGAWMKGQVLCWMPSEVQK